MEFSKHKILHSFVWKLSERFSVQGISFIVSICLARLLRPSEYGEIALIMVFINIANVIIDGGLNTALIQKKDANKTDFSTIFYATMVASLFIYVILFLSAPAIASFYSQPSLDYVIKVVGTCLFAYAFNSIQRAYISKHMLFKNLFLSSLLSTIIAGAIGIVLAYRGHGIWALVYHYIASGYIMALVMFATVKWRPDLSFSLASFKTLFDYGWKIFLSNFMISLFVNIRSLIIGKFYTPAYLAYFERGKQMPTLIMENINTSTQTVLFPVFSAQQGNLQQIRNMVSRSIKTSSLVIFPLLVGLFVTAKPLIITMLTEKWLTAVPFVQIFCIAYLFMPLQIANLEAMKAIGRSDIFLKLEMIKKVLEVSILVTSVFINVYAIAIGVAIYNFLCIFINTYPNKKLIGYTTRQLWTDIYPPLLASAAMGGLVFFLTYLPLGNLAILSLQVITGIISYLAICVMFKLESFTYIRETILKKRDK